jgi:hypothetical protein
VDDKDEHIKKEMRTIMDNKKYNKRGKPHKVMIFI